MMWVWHLFAPNAAGEFLQLKETAARARAVADTNSAVDGLPEEVPKALQASECRELLDLARTR